MTKYILFHALENKGWHWMIHTNEIDVDKLLLHYPWLEVSSLYYEGGGVNPNSVTATIGLNTNLSNEELIHSLKNDLSSILTVIQVMVLDRIPTATDVQKIQALALKNNNNNSIDDIFSEKNLPYIIGGLIVLALIS